MSKAAIAFVDNHPVLVEGVSGLLETDGEFEVVAIGRTASEAVFIARSSKPSVLVIDLGVPGNAFDAIRSISQSLPATSVVAFSALPSVEAAVKALECGARGYVLKGSNIAELREAIRGVIRGDTFITQGIAVKVITALRNASLRQNGSIRLSVREDQIVRALLRGHTNRQIAADLSISEKTVKHYMTILMQKLKVHNRLEVVIAAQKLGVSYRDAAVATSA